MMKRLLILCYILALFPNAGWTQTCGLAQDQYPIELNDQTIIPFEVTNVLKNDLADPAQGVCAVDISMVVGPPVTEFQVWLVSPDGTRVELIGPYVQSFLPGGPTRFNIRFVPDGVAVNPDPGYPNRWNNNIPGGYFPLLNPGYRGTYYPVERLQNFDSGPVNGTWQLIIENSTFFELLPNTLFDLRLTFCDEAGRDCCFADAGELRQDDLSSCEGSADLQLDLPPAYPLDVIQPDTNVYTYTYAISQSGILIGYNSIPDLSGYPPGTYQLCGLSYKRAEQNDLPAPNGALTIDELRDNLNGADPFLCANLSSNCVLVTILPHSPPVALEDIICEGDSLIIGTDTLTTTGLYTITLVSSTGCDSIVEFDLTVLPRQVIDLIQTSCAGDSVRIGTSIYSASGQYTDTLQAVNGCDSIINLNLTVLPPLVTSLADTICPGRRYTLGDSIFTRSGNYTVVLPASTGCDSTVNLALTVIDLDVQFNFPDTITCAVPEVLLSAEVTAFETPVYTWFDDGGNLLGTAEELPVRQAGTYILEVSQFQCSVRDTVTVAANLARPVADAGPPDTLNCRDKTQLIIGALTSSQGPDFTYNWTTRGGHFVDATDQLQVAVDSGGIYQLIVASQRNGCADTAQVEIFAGNIPPVAEAGPNQLITCAEPIVSLDGSASSQTAGLEYTWTALRGNLQTTNDPLRPQATATGIYELTVLNPVNGCSSQDRVAVFTDTIAPAALIVNPEQLTCDRREIQLNAQLTDGGDDPIIEWRGPRSTSITSGANTLNPLVAEAGIYRLLVTNSDNGCVDSTQVQVEANVDPPSIEIGSPDTIRCNGQGVTLEYLSNLDPSVLTIQWTGPAGAPLGNALTQEATLPGTYQLDVTDNRNGCTARDSVDVISDTAAPQITLGDLVKACDVDTFPIPVSTDRNPALFSIQWTGPGIISGSTELSPLVSEPGEYLLTLTYLNTDCSFRDTATVTEPPCGPCLETDPAPSFTCNETNLQLEVRLCDICAGCTIEWTTTGGQIISGANTLTPTIGQAGTYIISVTDTFNLTAQLEIAVAEVRDFPVAIAGQDTTLNCRASTILLGNDNTDQGAGFQIRWRSLSTGSTSLGTTPFLEVNRSDTYILEVRNLTSRCISRDTVTVGLDTIPPIADAGPDTSLTCLNGVILLDGSNSSSGANMRYTWTATDGGQIDRGLDTPMPQISTAGTYTLQVLNKQNGCSASDQAMVSQDNTPPAISLPPPATLTCTDSTILLEPLNADPTSFRYEWCALDAGGTAIDCRQELTYTARAAGSYRLRVSDLRTGCENTATVTITEDLASPFADAGPDTTVNCFGNQVQLAGTTSGQPNITWNTPDGRILGGGNTATPQIEGPGLYVLTATDPSSGCSAIDTVLVTSDQTYPEARLTQDASSLILNCENDTLLVDGSASIAPGRQGLAFLWQTEEVTNGLVGPTNVASVRIISGGSYLLQVQDLVNGCRDTMSFQVNIDFIKPGVNILPAETITCNRPSVTINAGASETGAGVRHRWYRDGQLLPNSNLVLAANRGGTYLLESTYLANGCSNTATAVVKADTLAPLVQIAQPRILDCDNPVATLDASATTGQNLRFRWSTTGGNILSGQETAVATVNAPGPYNLLVTNSNNGCSGRASINVNFSGQSIGQIPLTITPPSCFGKRDGKVIIGTIPGGTGPFVFALNDDNFTTNNTFSQLPAGAYRLTVMDAAGCEADTTFTLREPEAVEVSLGPDRKIRQGEEIRLEALTNVKNPQSIRWSPAELVDLQDILIQILRPNRSATYGVEITDENGCSAADEVLINVSNELPVYISNAFSPNEDGENDRFFIQAGTAVTSIRSFRIFDRWGNTVFETSNIPPNDPQLGWDGSFRGQPMDAAVFVYFAEVELTDGEVEMVQGEVALIR